MIDTLSNKHTHIIHTHWTIHYRTVTGQNALSKRKQQWTFGIQTNQVDIRINAMVTLISIYRYWIIT